MKAIIYITLPYLRRRSLSRWGLFFWRGNKIKEIFIIYLLTIISMNNVLSASSVDLTPDADGHYDRSYFCCPEDPPICGGCFDDYEIVENGIKVTYYYDPNVSCGLLCGLPGSSLGLRMGIMEFDISGLSGLFIRGQLQATLHLTVKSGDLPVDRCLSFYSIQDANENGMVELVDKDTEDYVGEICENLQPGNTISIDVTSALEHDAFDPDQTSFSGFVIGRSTNWADNIEFYDHTDPENGPRLSVIDTQCEGNFDCDEDCDGGDAAEFKLDFGRSNFGNPCTNENQCHGDFDCDADVDGTDAVLFKEDFGRSSFNNPCPTCEVGDWCVYDTGTCEEDCQTELDVCLLGCEQLPPGSREICNDNCVFDYQYNCIPACESG